jgi:hypothetical protein
MVLFSYTTFIYLWFSWAMSLICLITCIEACSKCLRDTEGTRLIAAFFTSGWLKLLLFIIWGYTETVGMISLHATAVDKLVVTENKAIPWYPTISCYLNPYPTHLSTYPTL